MPRRHEHRHVTVSDGPHYVVPKYQPAPQGQTPPGGFTQVFNRFIDDVIHEIKSVSTLRVYLMLARLADPRQQYTVRIGQKALADLCRMSPSSVHRAIEELTREMKCVAVTDEGGSESGDVRRVTEYQLLVPVERPKNAVPDEPTPVRRDNGTTVTADRGTTITRDTGTTVTADRGTPVTRENDPCHRRHPFSNRYSKDQTNKRDKPAADAAVGEILKSVGVGGANLNRLAAECSLPQVQKARREMWVEEVRLAARGKVLENPAGWVIGYLDGTLPPHSNPRAAKDAGADADRKRSLKATRPDYVTAVETMMADLDLDTFTQTACEVITDTGQYNEQMRDHFLRNPTPSNFQLAEKVYARLSRGKRP